MINQLQSNTVWRLRGNFLNIPTDCPQRDERLGWTGDITPSGPSAAFLFDVRQGCWATGLRTSLPSTSDTGFVPFVVPDIFLTPTSDKPALWGDVSVQLPWTLYTAYGDEHVLARQLRVAAHRAPIVDRVAGKLHDGLWDAGFQFGDWLDPDAPPDAAAGRQDGSGSGRDGLPTLRAARGRRRRAARKTDDAESRALAERTRAAFHVSTSRPSGPSGPSAPRPTRWPSCSTCSVPIAGSRPATRSPGSSQGRPPHLDRFRRDAVRLRGAGPDRTPRGRLRAAAAARVPVVALPGDDGGDDGLGALGLDAARTARSTPAR